MPRVSRAGTIISGGVGERLKPAVLKTNGYSTLYLVSIVYKTLRYTYLASVDQKSTLVWDNMRDIYESVGQPKERLTVLEPEHDYRLVNMGLWERVVSSYMAYMARPRPVSLLRRPDPDQR